VVLCTEYRVDGMLTCIAGLGHPSFTACKH
jgi:hypothetical protein